MHAFGRADAEHGQPVAQDLPRCREEREARSRQRRIVDQEALGGVGIGLRPAKGPLGSQLRLRSASAASWPGGRAGTLLTKGTGALVT